MVTRITKTDIDRQRDIMARLREISDSRAITPLALVDTYGCQQNESDSEKLRGMLINMGYTITDSEFEADVIVMNTCAIRENAQNRVFGNLGALIHTKRANPSRIIAVCGCLAEQEGVSDKIAASYKHVDIMFGPHNIWRFPELLERALNERGQIFELGGDMNVIAEGLPVSRDGTVKAWLPVMYGCDNFCSYCVVPYVRGRERSRSPDAIIADARSLIESGCKDITLLGQNVNSYGKGAQTDFPDLLRRIDGIDGEFLIRFMTSHPKDAGEKLFSAMADCEKVAKHIHLPFQAGSDRILSLMNRGYTASGYLKLVNTARHYMPDIVITSDVIVGFPGETYDEFAETKDVLSAARFDALFTFIYSKRPKTPAASLPDDVNREEKQRRFEELLALQNAISREKHKSYVGKEIRVLVDEITENPAHPLKARTNGGRLVRMTGTAGIGAFVTAKITDSDTWTLFGQLAADN